MPWWLHLFYLHEVPGRCALVTKRETEYQCFQMCAFPFTIVHSKHATKVNLGFSVTVWHGGMKRCDFPIAESQHSPSVWSPQLSWSCRSLWDHLPQLSMFRGHGFYFNNKLRKPWLRKWLSPRSFFMKTSINWSEGMISLPSPYFILQSLFS